MFSLQAVLKNSTSVHQCWTCTFISSTENGTRLIPKTFECCFAEAWKAAHAANISWAKQIWGTTWLGNTRNTAWIFQQYRQIWRYTANIRSTDRFFYTAKTNIWECKLCRCWVATRPTISPTTNVFLPQRMQKAKDRKPWMGCNKASTSRSVNINHPCCKSGCDGKTRPKRQKFWPL